MRGGAVRLRRFERADFDLLLSWLESEDAMRQWAGNNFRWPLDEAQLQAYGDGSGGERPARLIFTAEDATSGTPVGHICLNAIDREHLNATVSRVLIAPEARGRGLCIALMEAILQVGFDELRLHRVDLAVYDFNAAAIACYERVGMQREGLLRETTRVGEAYWSRYVMSILAAEWRARSQTR